MRDWVPLLLLLALVLAAGLAGASRESVTEPDARSQPATPGANATHHVLSGTDAAPNNTTLTGLVLRYEAGRNVSLANVTQVQPFIFRNPGTSEYRVEDLDPENVSIEGNTIRVALAGTATIDPGDEVGIEIQGVGNPPEAGPLNTTLVVNPDGPNRTRASATLYVEPPAPRLSNQGRVGTYQRIAVRWPGGVSGFLVARTTDSRVVGVTEYSPSSTLHVDGGIQNFLDTSKVAPGSTVVLTAYRDVDGDGTYDDGTEPVFTDNGENVSIRVTDALQTTTTTTTTTGPHTTTTTAPSTSTTQSPATTASTTNPRSTDVGTPGFSLHVGVVAVLGALLAVRLV